MTADELRTFFHRNEAYRFLPTRCREASLSLLEAKFLKALALSERDNRWVISNFGVGLAYKLTRRGLIENPLGESGNAHTNLWHLTAEGVQALNSIIDMETTL